VTDARGNTVTHEYDPKDRMNRRIDPLGKAETFQYDATGNRLTTGGSFARSGLPAAVPASSYDGANQQLTFGSVTQTFDANGNLLTQTDATGTTTYTCDARNRLTTLTGPTVTATFAYDALGRRTTKTINGQSTSVLYDGLDTVKESGADGDTSYLRTLGIDEALSRTDATGTFTYLSDALGSTLALTDATGTPTTAYTYAPFGETTSTGTPSASPFQFTGRENDGTGLYCYRARYYDPVPYYVQHYTGCPQIEERVSHLLRSPDDAALPGVANDGQVSRRVGLGCRVRRSDDSMSRDRRDVV
jgi:YD repeat-containing protein